MGDILSNLRDRLVDLELIMPESMRQADENAVRVGNSLDELIGRAASAIVRVISPHLQANDRIAVLAGAGMNGRDAVAAADMMKEEGRSVDCYRASRDSDVGYSLSDFAVERYDIVIDGLFGAGLSRDIEGEVADTIEAVNKGNCCVWSIDLPSGIDGRTGQVRGIALQAAHTITFVQRKPGHVLQPGRSYCGELHVEDIDFPRAALEASIKDSPPLYANEPDLWKNAVSVPSVAGHKYDRGHAVIFSGTASHSGAARLAATAALRAGAGLTTIFSPSSALMVNACHLTAIMLRRCEPEDLAELLQDTRFNAFVLGPGFGTGAAARNMTAQILTARRRLVLDADGITSFGSEPQHLFNQVRSIDGADIPLVLTPHSGEFARMFPDIAASNEPKFDKARLAAQRSGAIVVLKGADTVIAAPDGRVAINATGTAWLATAGTGDVLAGTIAGQLAQNVPTFEAACIGVWMHGRAAEHFGPGLIAEDLANCYPVVHKELMELVAVSRSRSVTPLPPP